VPAESGFRLLPDLLDESVRWMHVDHILEGKMQKEAWKKQDTSNPQKIDRNAFL